MTRRRFVAPSVPTCTSTATTSGAMRIGDAPAGCAGLEDGSPTRYRRALTDPTETMATPFDLFHTYMRAFKAGVSTSVLGEWHAKAQTHDDRGIREAWHDGYAAGKEAKEKASRHAQRIYEYTPSILRTQGDDEEHSA